MGFMDEKLWEILKAKAEEEDADLRPEQQIGSEYISAVKHVCSYGVQRAETIRDSFPMFTLHNEVHICNVMRLMTELLGDAVSALSRDEAGMLILAACCHDIGMSYSEKDKEELFTDIDRLNKYLDDNKSEYVKAYAHGGEQPQMTDDMIQNYLRSIHHERILELLHHFEWPQILNGKIDREDLTAVCQSHGQDISMLEGMENTSTIDLRFCSILLRLADILDFDTSRAPESVYEYSGFDKNESSSAIRSKEEWDKHMSSHGFHFRCVTDRSYPYNLDYSASSKSMQAEQTILSYLDWVDQELTNCGRLLGRFTGKWQNFVLPGKIKRNIKSEGYISGQYCLTLDQNQVLDLLVGKELYRDPSVFVRELIQNAIDAVRTREQLDKNLPRDWKGQIRIRTWMDEERYHWFRIEDNGIGMTEDIIRNFFLKIGSSYYTSDTFQQEKLRCKADADYMPISRFGIGILSCFMGDERTNRVEVSTKHFNENRIYYPALRLSMSGVNGYYYMASSEMKHQPGPMKGVTKKEQEPYLNQAGTVIAVRTKLYQSGQYRSFKEIIDKYVTYPSVAIHYDGEEGSFDYPTEAEFMEVVHGIAPSDDEEKKGVIEFPLTEAQLRELQQDIPGLVFLETPKIILQCIPLDNCTKSPYLSGAMAALKAIGETEDIEIKIGDDIQDAYLNIEEDLYENLVSLNFSLHFTSSFENRMRAIGENFRNCDFEEETKHKLLNLWQDELHRDIVYALLYKQIYNSQWVKDIRHKFNIDIMELERLIFDIQKKVEKISGILIPTRQEMIDFQVYEKMNRKWSFFICDLSKIDWYTEFFESLMRKTNLENIASHNGILCGDANFFTACRYKGINLGTVILFKDKYRPDVDLARDCIRMLPLETICDVALIKRHICSLGYQICETETGFERNTIWSFPMAKFMNLLEKRPDFKEQLLIKADNKAYSPQKLEQKIKFYGKVELQEIPTLSNKFQSNRYIHAYYYLNAAYLRKNFALRMAFSYDDTKIYALNEQDDISQDYIEILPATFFLKPLEEECTYLTTNEFHIRRACNANHPLSQFIIKNCYKLNKYAPGILTEILRILAEEFGTELIENINEILNYLRSMYEEYIDIPGNLILTEDDIKFD